MAFSTIQGSGGAPDSFVGTTGVDSIAVVNSNGNYFLGANTDADVLNFNTTASALYNGVVSNATIKGGDGRDRMTWASAAATTYTNAFINGNGDRDTFTTNANDTFLASTISGGAANDTVAVNANITSTVVNGNKGIDTITTGLVITSSSVRGGGGGDLVTIGDAGNDAVTNSLVNGDLGNDRITFNSGTGSLDGTSIMGGEGTDNITFAAAAVGTGTDSLFLNGNAGDDTITLAAASVIGATTVFGGAGSDTIVSGGAAATDLVTLVGGAGADTITADAQATDIAIFDTLTDGGASASATSGAVLASGDTLIGFDTNAALEDVQFSASALSGSASAINENGAAGWDLNSTGVYREVADANFTYGTTTATAITTAINTAIGASGVIGDIGDVGYFVFDGTTNAAGDAAIIQVTLGTTRATGAGTALDAGDTIAFYALGGAGTSFDGAGVQFIA